MPTEEAVVSDKAIVKWMADILDVNLKICEKDSLSIVMSKPQAEILLRALRKAQTLPEDLIKPMEKMKLLAARLESAVQRKDGPWDGMTAESELAHSLVDKAINDLQ